MMHRIWMIAGLTAAWLLLPHTSLRGDYLGKSAEEWQSELKRPDLAARRSAAFALGKLGSEARGAVLDLVQCVQSETEDVSVRETAAWSLGQIATKSSAPEEVIQVLCKFAAANQDERVQRSAVVALGSCGRDLPAVRSALEKAVAGGKRSVRQNAVWALGEICQKTDNLPLSSLRNGLRDKEDDKLVKRDAALALNKVLTYQLHADDHEAQQLERQRCAKVAEQARAALDDLLKCVGHDYVELKKAACTALIQLLDPADAKAKPILAKACNDGDIEVRRNAALALAAVGGEGSEAAVPVLRDALRGGDAALRATAALAFSKLGSVGQGALPDLLKVLAADADPKVRYNVAVALGEWKVDASRVVPELVKRLIDRKETKEIRVAAAVSLKNLGQCEEALKAIPSLVRILDDPRENPQVRERILWALTVHQRDLLNYEDVFEAMKKVVAEPGLRSPESGGKMLRFHSAYLLGVFKKGAVPDEVFPVLLDFLKDSKIVLFKARKTTGGSVGEGGGGSTDVSEQGSEDGRIMAFESLKKIATEDAGKQRVKHQAAIIAQVRELRDSGASVEQKIRDEAAELLKNLGVK